MNIGSTYIFLFSSIIAEYVGAYEEYVEDDGITIYTDDEGNSYITDD